MHSSTKTEASTTASIYANRAHRRGRAEGGPAIQNERLVRVLLELASVEDESAISMRRVASELGVSARLLYQYVSGRAELFSLLVDAVSAHFPLPAPDASWQERLKAIAWASWREITRYPGLSPHTLLDSVRYKSSRHARHMVDEIMKALQDAGLPQMAVNQAHLSLAALLLGHLALFETQRHTTAEDALNFGGMFDWRDLDSSFETSINSIVAGIEAMVEKEE